MQRLSPTISFLEDLRAMCVPERTADRVPWTISVTDDNVENLGRSKSTTALAV